ncbi:MAG: peptidylprolyl isomerase [Candidatus Colwellbacteria bacterium]|nr:peptidylprolyl isomerase [Candidatus Colwellbacteria bacterium]
MKKKAIIAIAIIGLVAISWFLLPKVFKSRPSENNNYEYGQPQSESNKEEQPSVENNNNTGNKEPAKEEIKMESTYLITLKTNLGNISFETYNADAPKTVDNFVTLARKGFYNGVIFHRVIDGFMIQGGDPTGTGMGGPGYTFEDELNPQSDSYKRGYVKGTVAMANAGPDTNGSQFFIMVADIPLPHDYTIFGHIVEGQDVANKISVVERDSRDKPLSPVTITEVTVTEK